MIQPYANTMDNFLNETPAGQFINRTSQTSAGVTENKTTTGNPTADKIATATGNVMEFFAPMGGSGVVNGSSNGVAGLSTFGKKFSQTADNVVQGTGKATLGEIKQATEFLKNNGLTAAQRREVIEAFNPGAQVVKLQDDLVVYRYSGGAANPKGRWVTTEQLSDPVNQLALPPGSTAENVTKWVIPKDTEVFQGTVAPNFGKQGGAAQIYIPDPSVLK